MDQNISLSQPQGISSTHDLIDDKDRLPSSTAPADLETFATSRANNSLQPLTNSPPRAQRFAALDNGHGNDEDDDSTSASEKDPDDDDDDVGSGNDQLLSVMGLENDSQTSLGVSMEEMEIDAAAIEAEHRRSPISRLPAEVLLSIFSRFSSPADLLNCMLTCKYWARNSVELLWHKPMTDAWPDFLRVTRTLAESKTFFDYKNLIKRVNLAKIGSTIGDHGMSDLRGLGRVERLTLTDCFRLTDRSIIPIIRNNTNLLAIDVTGIEGLTDDSLLQIADSCCKLQGLNVTRCRTLTDQSLCAVARNCRRLKRLKLNECTAITDKAILEFADFCPDLVEIDLFRVTELTDTSPFELLTRCHHLREVRLAHCSNITDNAFDNLPVDRIFESLRILDLTDCHELGDAGLQRIVEAAPKLRNLVLAKCRNITDRGIMSITKLGKNLHFIHLGHCHRISDVGVNALTKYCNRIRYIDLACCHNLTDASVRHLALLPKLKRIGLVKCTLITDASIRALAQPKPPGANGTVYPNSLERLHLSYCTNLSIKGIRSMLLSCPRLNHLSLTGVPEFLRQDLFQFCRPPPAEFNDHQREVFCVFSGNGVAKLRRYLQDQNPVTVQPDALDMLDTNPQIPWLPWLPAGVNAPQQHAQQPQTPQHQGPLAPPPPPPHARFAFPGGFLPQYQAGVIPQQQQQQPQPQPQPQPQSQGQSQPLQQGAQAFDPAAALAASVASTYARVQQHFTAAPPPPVRIAPPGYTPAVSMHGILAVPDVANQIHRAQAAMANNQAGHTFPQPQPQQQQQQQAAPAQPAQQQLDDEEDQNDVDMDEDLDGDDDV